MRALFLLPLALLAVACRGTQPYSQTDLVEVKQAYVSVHPTYLAFKRAFQAGNGRDIMRLYRREHAQCRLVDTIDKRDTIDPNVNLYQASITLDDMCNAIESAYVFWAKKHRLPYDKIVVPARPREAFVGSDADLKKIKKYFRHPSALA